MIESRLRGQLVRRQAHGLRPAISGAYASISTQHLARTEDGYPVIGKTPFPYPYGLSAALGHRRTGEKQEHQILPRACEGFMATRWLNLRR